MRKTPRERGYRNVLPAMDSVSSFSILTRKGEKRRLRSEDDMYKPRGMV